MIYNNKLKRAKLEKITQQFIDNINKFEIFKIPDKLYLDYFEELKKYLDVENMKRKTLINMIIHSENTNLYYKDENSEQKSEDTIYFKRLKKWLDKIRQK